MNEVVCPKNPKWLRAMLDLLPSGLRGKLEAFAVCLEEKQGQGRVTPVLKE